MSIITNTRKSGTTYTAVVRKGPYRTKPLKKTFPTKGEAKFWKAEQERLIGMKRYRDPRLADRVNLSEALKKFAEHGTNILKKAPSTLEREKYSRKHLERLIGDSTPLSEINPAVVTKYQNDRISEKASASAIRQELSQLSRMFRIAKTSWMLPVDNPVDRVDRISPDIGRERFLSNEEATLVIGEAQKMKNKKFYPFALLLMHTGMRTGEAARLTIKDIDLKKRMITIRHTKTNRPRTIGISREAVAALLTLKLEDNGYLFLKPHHRNSKSTMLQPGSIFRDCWKHLYVRLKEKHQNNPDFPLIEPFKPHDIRHTAASHLLRQGVDVRIIADILGHSTLQMVMRYTHLFDESKIEYADKISYLGIEKEKAITSKD